MRGSPHAVLHRAARRKRARSRLGLLIIFDEHDVAPNEDRRNYGEEGQRDERTHETEQIDIAGSECPAKSGERRRQGAELGELDGYRTSQRGSENLGQNDDAEEKEI